MEHVYSKDEAQRVVNAFPAGKLDELIQLATSAKSNPMLIWQTNAVRSGPLVGHRYDRAQGLLVVAFKGDRPQRWLLPRNLSELQRQAAAVAPVQSPLVMPLTIAAFGSLPSTRRLLLYNP